VFKSSDCVWWVIIVLVLMCFVTPNREPFWPALDQFFAAPLHPIGAAALGSLRSPSLRAPDGVERREDRQLQTAFYTGSVSLP